MQHRFAKWIHSRILRQVCIPGLASCVSNIAWQTFFWTMQGRFRSLHIASCTDALHWATDHRLNLSELCITNCRRAVGISVGKIIRHNASTLVSLKLENNYQSKGALPALPMLRVAHLRLNDFAADSIVEQLLKHSPHLESLSICTDSMDRFLDRTIAVTTTDLQALELEHMTIRSTEFWLTIGNALGHLTQLKLSMCSMHPILWCNAAQAMPHLQSLKCDTWSDQISAALGTSVGTALRVLDLKLQRFCQ